MRRVTKSTFKIPPSHTSHNTMEMERNAIVFACRLQPVQYIFS